jgi:diguanylate cyclase (GGDEF)-like protein
MRPETFDTRPFQSASPILPMRDRPSLMGLAWRRVEAAAFQRLGLGTVLDAQFGTEKFSTLLLARTLLLMMFALSIAILGFAVSGTKVVDAVTREAALSGMSAFFVVLVIATLMVIKGRYALARWLAVGGSSITVGLAILFTGGIANSVALPILTAIPCFCYCLVSVRVGLIAAVAGPLAILVTQFVLSFIGVRIPDYTSQSSGAFNNLMVSGAIYLMMTLCMGGLVRANERLSGRLREEHAKLEQLASIDPLTGIANRRVFDIELEAVLALGAGRPGNTGLLLIDLNGFKPINDHYGHPVGDEVLKTVATRLSQASAIPHLVARLGGDEFVAIVTGPTDLESMERLGRVIRTSIEAPMRVAGVSLNVGAAIGVAVSPDDGVTAGQLVRAADAALYHDKRGTLVQGPWAERDVLVAETVARRSASLAT